MMKIKFTWLPVRDIFDRSSRRGKRDSWREQIFTSYFLVSFRIQAETRADDDVCIVQAGVRESAVPGYWPLSGV